MPLPEKVYFDAIKEARGNYLVEYSPPRPDRAYADLSVSCDKQVPDDEMAEVMEAELRRWSKRYAYPVLVSGFDPAGDLMELEAVRPSPFLVGWVAPGEDAAVSRWGWFEDAELPTLPLDVERLLRTYAGVPYKTPTGIEADLRRRGRVVRALKWLMVVVYVVIPATILVLGVTSPIVGWTTFAVSAIQLVRKLLELMGVQKPSPRKQAEDEELRRMRHYAYHCDRNPEGFARLRAENHARELRQDFEGDLAKLRGAQGP